MQQRRHHEAMHAFTEPGSRAESDATYPLMAQLRPELGRADYADLVESFMREEGFRLVVLHADDGPAALAGYRYISMLYCGRALCIDDLVVDAKHRGSGLGKRMLGWLEERASQAGCRQIQLVSRVVRERAHRFYHANGFGMECFHFRKILRPATESRVSPVGQ